MVLFTFPKHQHRHSIKLSCLWFHLDDDDDDDDDDDYYYYYYYYYYKFK